MIKGVKSFIEIKKYIYWIIHIVHFNSVSSSFLDIIIILAIFCGKSPLFNIWFIIKVIGFIKKIVFINLGNKW